MKKYTIKNCSNNHLNEAIYLCSSLIGDIENKFCHVEIFPKSILKSIQDFQDKLFKEEEKREAEM